MKPTEAFEELASIVVAVTKRPYRAEPITYEEWDSIADQIYVLIGKQKARCHGDVGNQEAEAAQSKS